MSISGGPKINNTGLLMYLDAANTKSLISGSNSWYDLSGNNHTGSFVGGASFNTASSYSSVYLNGTSSYVSIGTGNTYFPLPQFTLDVWYQSNSTGSNQGVVSGLMAITYGINMDIWSPQHYIFRVTSASVFQYAYSPTSYATRDDTYHNVVSTNDGFTSSIYVNGNLASITPTQLYFGTTVWPTSNASLGWDVNDGAKNHLSGSIAQARIFNRVLSADEINQNFNALRSRFSV
jgi:hypothetical protein